MLRELLREYLGLDNQPVAPPTPSDYDLKIDAQVEKFVENKQKLVYFLITASATVIGFIVNFAVAHPPPLPSLVIFASIAGLLTCGFSLLNLRLSTVPTISILNTAMRRRRGMILGLMSRGGRGCC